MKDPAFLFYSSDFLTGTNLMSNEEVGKYIRLLCYQHQEGVVNQDHIDHVGGITPRIQKKFELDEQGNLFNKRLRVESEKRKNYTESRRANRLKKNDEEKDMNNISSTHDNHMNEHMLNHMTNHMENENENRNKDKTSRYVSETYPQLVSFYNNLFGRNIRGCSKSRKQYSARVKEGYKLEDVQKAITAMHQDKYHRDTDYKYAMLELITREDKLERFMNITDKARESENMTEETRYWKLIEIIKLKPRDNSRFTYEERKFIIDYQATKDRFPPDDRKLVQDTCSLTRAEIDQKNREEGWIV